MGLSTYIVKQNFKLSLRWYKWPGIITAFL